jgi:hypothetical protein
MGLSMAFLLIQGFVKAEEDSSNSVSHLSSSSFPSFTPGPPPILILSLTIRPRSSFQFCEFQNTTLEKLLKISVALMSIIFSSCSAVEVTVLSAFSFQDVITKKEGS